MSRARLLLLAAACCLAAAGAAVLSRGSHAATPAPQLPKQPAASKPTLAPVSSVDTVTTVQRTFVSVTGSDTNPCSATSPCRSFGTAIGKTTAGGEVVALTSGGYGPVGIGMAVSLIGAPGVHAAITATSGGAIDVEAGSNDTVILRNLYLNGLGASVGINYSSGHALQLENVTLSGFGAAGLYQTAPNGQLYATDLVVRHNYVGIEVDPISGTAHVTLDRVRAEDNFNIGIDVYANARLRVSDSIASGDGDGIYTNVPTMVSGCQLSDNATAGIFIGGGGTAQIGGSTVTDNGSGFWIYSGTLQSFGDNLVAGNSTDIQGTISTIAKT